MNGLFVDLIGLLQRRRPAPLPADNNADIRRTPCLSKGVRVSSRKNTKVKILHPPRRNANYEYIRRAIFRDSWFTMHTLV